jgi:heme-degrading monooxygenase HmoA
MRSLVYDLDTHAPSDGFLGGNSWMNTCDRDAGSEIMTLCYFKSHEDLQAFAHSEHHRKVWDWWIGLMKEKKAQHISIAHEVYAAPKGAWEGVYINHVPSMLGKDLYAAAHVHSGLPL